MPAASCWAAWAVVQSAGFGWPLSGLYIK